VGCGEGQKRAAAAERRALNNSNRILMSAAAQRIDESAMPLYLVSVLLPKF